MFVCFPRPFFPLNLVGRDSGPATSKSNVDLPSYRDTERRGLLSYSIYLIVSGTHSSLNLQLNELLDIPIFHVQYFKITELRGIIEPLH